MKKKINKRLMRVIVIITMMLLCVSCAPNSNDQAGKEYDYENKITQDTKVLIAFFSRADENYGVGYIEKGNTQVIAEYIGAHVKADMFQIARKTPYPAAYRDCTEEAESEKNANARPELAATLASIEQYDVIFLGYPIWYSTMPMPVYTFLESFDFSGKIVIPFSTNEGSGFGTTLSDITEVIGSDATFIRDGFSCRGSSVSNQNAAVASWISELNIDFE